jgi:hypothetical protein
MPATFGHPFTLNGAKHFCRPAGAMGRVPPQSFRDLVSQKSTRGTLLEGKGVFEDFRTQALREIDRQLFLALSNYRRSRDLMLYSSASWSWVTLYYSSFHAASALLGCLGVTVDSSFNGTLIDVLAEGVGNQSLYVRPCPRTGPTGHGGSHGCFWDAYYYYMAHFKGALPPKIQAAADLVSSSETWQIDQRNQVNYDTFVSLETCSKFNAGFDHSRFPACLEKNFATQHNTTVLILDAAMWIAHTAGLQTDVLDPFFKGGTRRQRFESAIESVTPPFPAGQPLFEPTIPDSDGRSIRV